MQEKNILEGSSADLYIRTDGRLEKPYQDWQLMQKQNAYSLVRVRI